MRDYHSENKSFQVYKEWEDIVEALGSDEEAGRLFKALFAYASRGEEPDFSGALKIAFLVMSQQFERDGVKWEERREIYRQNGLKGGRPKKSDSKTNGFSEKPKKGVKVEVEAEVKAEAEVEAEVEAKVDNCAGAQSAPALAQSDKQSLGRFGNVKLSGSEYDELCREYGKSHVENAVKSMDQWIQAKGKSPYTDYFAALTSWIEKDMEKSGGKKKDSDLDISQYEQFINAF